MHFLSPWYAAFVLLGVLPVLIHLMGRRRARVRPLPTLLLLYASHRRVAQRTQLRHLLLLLLRMLVMIVVPLCLAKPFIETASDLPAQISAAQSAVLVLDDSLSMRYLASADGRIGRETLFARAKKRATRIVEALPPNAEAALVLGARGNQAPVPELTGDRARLFSAISGLQPSLRATELSGALRRATQILATVRRAQRRIYLITDSASHAIESGLRPPTDVEVTVIDVSDGQLLPNHAIVDLHSEPAPSLGTRALRVTAELANFSDNPLKEQTVTLLVDGRPVASGLIDLPPNGRAVKRFFHIFRTDAAASDTGRETSSGEPPGERHSSGATSESALAPSGLHHLSVSIEHDALPEDDVRHLRVEVQRHLKVLILDGDARTLRRDDEVFYLEMALHPGDRPGGPGGEDAPFVVTTLPVDDDLPSLTDFDAVFLCNAKAQDLSRRQLDKALRDYVTGGGGLFIALGDNVDVDAYNSTLAELLPQPLAVVKTPGTVRESRSDEGRESAPNGSGEHLGRLDRRHPLLVPFATGRASESLLLTRFGRYMLLRPTLKSSGDSSTILSFESGAPALIERVLGRGRVLLFASTLDRDWNDLPIQPAFLPLAQQAVRYLARAPLRESEQPTLIGQSRDIKLQAGDTRVEVTLPSVQKRLFERLGGRQILSFNDTIESGFYRVSAASDAGSWRPRPAEFFVVNVDPAESDLRHASPALISALQRSLMHNELDGVATAAPRRRVELWHYLGLMLLLFLVGEALLLRSK